MGTVATGFSTVEAHNISKAGMGQGINKMAVIFE